MAMDIRSMMQLSHYLRASATVLGNAAAWKTDRPFASNYKEALTSSTAWACPRWQDGLASMLLTAAMRTPQHFLFEWAELIVGSLNAIPNALLAALQPTPAQLARSLLAYQ